MLLEGKKSKKYLTKKGQLRAIHKLKIWPLEEVLIDNYKFSKYVFSFSA
jgi:serine/threonine-protein kinase SRPK3